MYWKNLPNNLFFHLKQNIILEYIIKIKSNQKDLIALNNILLKSNSSETSSSESNSFEFSLLLESGLFKI